MAVERFNAEFFDGIDGYNKLMMSLDLYERFKNSTYLLIYQTDAFVFKDDLQYWCDRNYDYIGAPWPFDVTGWLDAGYPREVIRYHKIFGRKKVSSVGNGGLSLRKTSSFINNLRFFKPFMKRWKFNEDMFFSHYVNAMNPFFKIPKIKIARRFAFDVNPAEFLELNDHELPFGCHGWYRDDSDYEGNLLFWKKFIEAYGYSLP
ncbi:hypothetical protein ADIARSV_2818 [Arcticibacter svalbardensis MN12-7]|uniref:DUF5672 domain-containing protein n=1 Tax=Arcticibacter svalbardensis MN12-7 TaxID=1150600 RepID=R9GYC1_9SPHI|nr:hypothetical protein ADIARSV_2818 [Arcticibacter svalbardensis MN12-7]